MKSRSLNEFLQFKSKYDFWKNGKGMNSLGIAFGPRVQPIDGAAFDVGLGVKADWARV
jgi:hypothetical protein